MPTPSPVPKARTLRSYYEEWIERKAPPLVRLSTAKRHRLYFDAIVLPELGSALFQEITKSRLEAFRAGLLLGKTQRGTTRTVKAVRNIIDWHLRSLWRDAEREGYAGPFPRLDWPRANRAKPDPFDSDERDAILAWFAEHEPYWCPWLFFLFWTGMRHGEAGALRWSDIDLKRGIISISRSRDEGEDNAPENSRFDSRDSGAPLGRRSFEATSTKTSFRRLGIRLPQPGGEADDRHMVAEAEERHGDQSMTSRRVSGLGAFAVLGSGQGSST